MIQSWLKKTSKWELFTHVLDIKKPIIHLLCCGRVAHIALVTGFFVSYRSEYIRDLKVTVYEKNMANFELSGAHHIHIFFTITFFLMLL